MKLKNIILGIVAIVMIAAITVGITVAYLTDTDTAENKMTIGDVDIALREYERVSVDTPNASEEAQVQKFNDNKPLLPAVLGKEFDYAEKDASVKWDADKDGNPIKSGYTSAIWEPDDVNNEVDKMVFVENVGMGEAYVRVFFAFEAGNYTSFTRFQDMIHINLNDTASEWKWEWNPALATSTNGGKYFIASATYQPILEPKQFTTISLSQISLDPTATNDDVLAFGEKYEISVFVQGIQKVGFETAEEAVDEGFGDEIPFKDLTFETGVNLKTALHYLNGEESEDKKITANVSTVTFGLNKDYKNITSKYNPTFIDSEQDVAVYSYYVPNADDASKYDVYVLADSAIYTPKDSTALFYNMTALTTVDTANMDVSRTENMTGMFCNCPLISDLDVSEWDVSKVTSFNKFLRCAIDSDGNGGIDTYNYELTSLDVSDWDTKSATDMSYMFHGCRALTSLDVSGWNVGSVSLFTNLFAFCNSLTSIDVEDWDTSKAINMNYMFCECVLLTELDLSGWNVSTVEQTGAMFEKCTALKKLNVSTWDVRNVFEMGVMFRRCEVLEELDLSQWKTDSLLRTNNMFDSCYMLKNIHFGDGWNMSKTTKIYGMFNNCKVLTYLDVSEWIVSNVVDMNTMFSNCEALTSLNVSNWNTSNVTNMKYMFNGCSSLTTLDVSKWTTDNVTDMSYMFSKCVQLDSLNVSDWNVSNVTNFSNFLGCAIDSDGNKKFDENDKYNDKLTSLDVSKWNTQSATDMSYMFWGCRALASLNVSGFNTSGVTNMKYMFSDCTSLTTLDVSSWDTAEVTTMEYMFNGCSSLTTLDVSGWNTAKVTTMKYMFNGCSSLTTLDVSNWNTAEVTTMEYMFKDCVGLTELDLGNWNTQKLNKSERMFAGCSNLQKIYVGVYWNATKIGNYTKMFENCTSLVGGNGTVYNTNKNDRTYARVDNAPDAPGYLTDIADKPANP
jgi:predicted ribosomally synthesized peptide with SipW-like signal peptide